MYWLMKKLIKGASTRSKRKILNFVLSTEIEDHLFHKLKRHGYCPESVIDVGAYHGEWTRKIKAIFPSSKVLMVDALAKESYLAKVTKELQECAFCIQLLGAETGVEKTFYECETGSSYYEENTNAKKIATTRVTKSLDDVLAEEHFSLGHSSLLKIDAQGSELDILEGAKNALPVIDFIYLEVPIVQYNLHAPDFEGYVHYLSKIGYSVFDVATHHLHQDLLLQVDILFARRDSSIVKKRDESFGH